MNTNEVCFDILDGPSRSDIIHSFEYVYDKGSKIKVGFETTGPKVVKNNDSGVVCTEIIYGLKAPAFGDVKIISIEQEDGSGYSFNLRGYCGLQRDLHAELPFKATYNSKRRKGTITIPKHRLQNP